MYKTKAINGELKTGDWVIAVLNNDYACLLGRVTAIEKQGTPEHGTANETDDIHVDFTAFDYPPDRIREIEDEFSLLYGEYKEFYKLPLDDVIMAPKMLIRITELGQDEIDRMGNLRLNCESFCKCFPGGAEPLSGRHTELMERLEKNLTGYHESLLGFGKRELIELADKIAAMSDVYSYMCFRGFEDNELDFLLRFQNPLEVIADGWRDYRYDNDDELGYAFDNVCRNKQDWLDSHPLINDSDATAIDDDPGLRRFMGVDLIAFLGNIADKVIVHYPGDWKIDIDALYRAAASDDPEGKRLMWHVCSYGTHLNTERETFIKDTGAYNTWVDYRPNAPDMFGYAVEVTGRHGNVVTGNVFEVGDYANHARHVRETALPLDSVTLTYAYGWGENSGKVITVPRYEYDSDRNHLMSKSGNVAAIRYHPAESVREMSAIMRQERSRRMAQPIGSQEAHLKKLADRLAEVRKPIEAIAQPEQSAKPPAAKRKPSILDRLADAGEEAKAYNAQRAQNHSSTIKKQKEID